MPIIAVIVKGAEAKLVLPATSVSVTVRLWVPADKLPVVSVQAPGEFTVVVASTVDPSNSLIVLLDSPVPFKVVVLVVAPKEDMLGCAGAVVSSVNVNEAVPVRPAELVSLATTVCDPSASPVGVNDHTPVALAVTVPSVFDPSVILTLAFGSAEPVKASFEVILSVDDTPVSLAREIVTTGADVGSLI